jgi:hypothetical protein
VTFGGASIGGRRLGARVAALAALLALALGAREAGAATLGAMRGHLALGYAKLLTAHGPAGSMAGAAGLDLPIGGDLRAGLEVGFDLLGTRTIDVDELGRPTSLIAELDYSLFEGLALVHWKPPGGGPIGRVSAGIGACAARIEQSSSGAAEFEYATLRKLAPAVAASVTLMPRRDSRLLGGLEVGGRYVVVPGDDWLLTNLRLVVHY